VGVLCHDAVSGRFRPEEWSRCASKVDARATFDDFRKEHATHVRSVSEADHGDMP
jgi:hypothetical protein